MSIRDGIDHRRKSRFYEAFQAFITWIAYLGINGSDFRSIGAVRRFSLIHPKTCRYVKNILENFL